MEITYVINPQPLFILNGEAIGSLFRIGDFFQVAIWDGNKEASFGFQSIGYSLTLPATKPLRFPTECVSSIDEAMQFAIRLLCVGAKKFEDSMKCTILAP